jgi:hypothetical protein
MPSFEYVAGRAMLKFYITICCIGARNRVRIGLSYRPARQCAGCQVRKIGSYSVPIPHKLNKIPAGTAIQHTVFKHRHLCTEGVYFAQCRVTFSHFGNSFFRHNIPVKGRNKGGPNCSSWERKSLFCTFAQFRPACNFFLTPPSISQSFCRYVSLFISLSFLFIV